MIDKQKQFKRQAEWNAEHRYRMSLCITKEMEQEWKKAAEARGVSLNKFVIDIVSKEITQG